MEGETGRIAIIVERVRVLYTLTIFLGSALLFLVEPMVAKMILPVFGGSAAVWNASVVFFQLMLLAGYAYAHGSVKLLGTKGQPVLHLLIIALALIALPFGLKPGYSPSQNGQPALEVIGLLLLMVGLPFFAVAAQAPLIQKWFSRTPDPASQDPYFLYSASNLGSMLALLAYPVLIEPRLTLSAQSKMWTGGYVALGILTFGSALAVFLKGRAADLDEVEETVDEPALTAKQRVRWVLLSAVPSSLMLGITSYLTTNIAPVPLLWIIPLAIYLLTFILAFSHRVHPNIPLLSRLTSILVLPVALVLALELWAPMVPLALLHLLTFFMLAWLCHTLLVQSRPSHSHLTEFYLWMAFGGVVGGAFNAFVAPLLFNSLIEYPIAIAVALVLIGRKQVAKAAEGEAGPKMNTKTWGWDVGIAVTVSLVVIAIARTGQYWAWGVAKNGDAAESPVALFIVAVFIVGCFLAIDRPLRYGLTLAGVMIFGAGIKSAATHILYETRDFFGVKRVYSYGTQHELWHGSTEHGQQNLANAETRREALTYYNPISPVGAFFKEFKGPRAKQSIAIVGLGAGTMAAYAEAGQDWTYYEIDPDVINVASDPKYFTYLSDCKARGVKLSVVQGDARLELAKAPPSSYDAIFLDAFSSDSVPVHLLTLEAIQMYLSKLKPGGVLAFHTSNRYLELPPVLERAALRLNLDYLYFAMDIDPDSTYAARGWTTSHWLIMARSRNDFAGLLKQPVWVKMDPGPGPVWTDDFSNVLSAFSLNPS